MNHLQAPALQTLNVNYQIEREAGRGGMGVVYQARDKRLDRLVAIKVLQFHQESQTEIRNEVNSRFQREARMLAGLSHPNLVTIYDVGEADGVAYMIMEYVQGKDISKLLGEGKKMPPALVVSIAQQVCQALAVAHEQGIVHRDIKPANMILSPKGQVKLMDFGIAQLSQIQQLEQGKLTQAGTLMGSVLYASPEQLRDARQVDFRSDIYSLGISLLEMLTGRSPYAGQSLSEMMLEIMSEESVSTSSERYRDIPEALCRILAHAVAKHPQDRYASVLQMEQELSKLFPAMPSPQSAKLVDSAMSLAATRAVLDPESQSQSLTLLRRTHLDPEKTSHLRQDHQWMIHYISQWPQQSLTQLNLESILDKLTERNIFGQGVSGCLVIDERFYLLFCNGVLVGAFDQITQKVQGQALNALPRDSERILLHTLPAEDITSLIFADILSGRGQRSQEHLDSSLMDLRPLLQNFSDPTEAFTGYLVCLANQNVFYYGYDHGRLIFSANVLDTGSDERGWQDPAQLVVSHSVLVHVFECCPEVLGHSLSQYLQVVELRIEHPQTVSLQTLCDYPDKDWPLEMVREVKSKTQIHAQYTAELSLRVGQHHFDLSSVIQQASPLAFTHFLIERYFYLLQSSGNASTLKYIYQWIPGVERVVFAQSLKGKDGNRYHFDGVVYGTPAGESAEKILFLIRSGSGSAHCLTEFLEAVQQVKQDHIKTGDIGGAFYLANSEVSDDALAVFRERTVEPRKSLMGLGSLDKLTRYKGFVRMGMKRGYHLNLFEFQHSSEQTRSFELLAPLLH